MRCCLACGTFSDGPVCPPCRSRLAPAVPVRLPGGILVVPGFRHEGTARTLVHRLKYRAVAHVAAVLAAPLAAAIPPDTTALVPVPRARLRRWRYGVDPAAELAAALAQRTGIPVRRALLPGWWWRRHAGAEGAARSAARFRARSIVGERIVLVDDVLTSGATLQAAAGALGLRSGTALTATAASRLRSSPERSSPMHIQPRDSGSGAA